MKYFKIIFLRTMAIIMDVSIICSLVILLSKIPLPNETKLKWLIIVLFTSAATAMFGLFANRYQTFVDKHKSRCDDLVILQRELNRLIVVIDGNITTLNKFTEEPPFNNPIVINPERILFNVDLTKGILNIALLNEAEELSIDYTKLNRDVLTIKIGYEKTMDLFLGSIKHQNIPDVETIKRITANINSNYEKDIAGLIKFLEYNKEKTVHVMAMIEPCIKRMSANHLKYLFWFATDWILSIASSYTGLWTELRYLSDEDLKKDAGPAYIRLKKSQQEVMKKSQEEISMIRGC